MQRIFLSSPVVVAFGLLFALFGLPAVAQESSDKPGGPDVSFALGVFGGGHIFADGTNLGVASAPEASAGARSNGTLGLRASVGVGPWLAAEAEVLGMLTTDRTYGRRAGILGYRLNALAFLRQGDVRPFVLLGAGPMQVATTRAEGKAGLVRDVEGEFHVGVGLCYQIVDILALRADVRAVQMPSKQIWSLTTDFEASLGLSFALGPRASAGVPAPAVANPPVLGPDKPKADSAAVTPPTVPAPMPPAAGMPTSPAPALATPAPVPSVANPPAPAKQPAIPREEQAAKPSTSPSPVADAGAASPSMVKELVSRAKEIKFMGATSKLSLVSLPLIGELAEAMVKEPGVQLEIVSHVPASGDPKNDMTLSRRRAHAVRKALVQREVPAHRLTATGRGSEEPLAPNVTRSGRRLNDRMELRLVDGDNSSR